MRPIDLVSTLATFEDHWPPRTIGLRDGTIELGPAELLGVPRSVEHRPVAQEDALILGIEPTGTPNTGDAATAAARRVI